MRKRDKIGMIPFFELKQTVVFLQNQAQVSLTPAENKDSNAMKKTRFVFTLLLAVSGLSILEISCASSPKNDTIDEELQEEAVSEKTVKEPKSLTVQNTSNQLEKNFKKLLDDIELKVVSAPKNAVYAGTAFKSPYIVSVTDANGAVADFDVTISWPASRKNDVISYSTTNMKTDAEGRIRFLPETPDIAVKDFVSFYPTPVSSSSEIVQAAFSAGVQSPFAVKSNAIKYPGGILYVYDFNENGRPTTNNFTLLQNLRNAGINAGNAPVSDTSYLNKIPAEIYTACKDIVGNAANFLIIGTFKYASPAVTNESGATVTLTAELTCLNMKDGAVLYATTITDSATDKNKWSAEQKCRASLGEKVADAVIYGM